MRRDTKLLALILAVAGVGHFVKPEPFESIVPKPLPAKRELVYVSGVVEVGCAAGLLHPRTRSLAGRVAALLLVAVFPANVQMTVDALRSRRAPWWYKVGTVLRLPVQVPLVRAALRSADDA
ncbi:MAG: DoxX family protein [Aeromicrobium erythreum]